MKWSSLSFLFFRTFVYSPRLRRMNGSFVISVLSLMVGFSSSFIALTVFSSFRLELERSFMDVMGHLLIEVTPPFNLESLQKILKKQWSHLQITDQNSFKMAEGLLHTSKRMKPILLKTMSASQFPLLQSTQKSFAPFDEQRSTPFIWVAQDLADDLRLQIGQILSIIFWDQDYSPVRLPFEVYGFFQTGLSLYDQRLVLVPDWVGEDSPLPFQSKQFLQFTLDQPHQAPRIAKELSVQEGWTAFSWYDSDPQLFRQIDRDADSIRFVMAVLLILAAFNLIATLTLSLSDKEFEISTWRLMGIPFHALLSGLGLWVFFMGILGILTGVCLGGIGLLLIGSYPLGDLQQLYFLKYFPVRYQPTLVIGLALSTLFLSGFAATFVIKNMLRISPLRGLKEGLYD